MEEELTLDDLFDIAAEAVENDVWTGSVVSDDAGRPIMVCFSDIETLKLLEQRFVPPKTKPKTPYILH